MLAGGAVLIRAVRAGGASLALLGACTFPGLEVVADASVDAPRDVTIDTIDVATADLVDAETFTPTPSCPSPGERGCARVRVEGGAFTLGGEGVNGPSQPGISVDDFTLDATEVTARRFRRFVAAMQRGDVAGRVVVDYPPPGRAHFTVDIATLGAYVDTGADCALRDPPVDAHDDHPINCVSWFAAMAFCIWDGGRLPTEAELEYTARWWRAGDAARTYPWGAGVPDCVRAQWRADPAASAGACAGEDGLSTRRVGSLAAGAVFGVYDLSGNVAEWCADEFLRLATTAAPNDCWGRGPARNPVCRTTATTDRATRGGHALTRADEASQLQTVARNATPARATVPSRGFRCARSP